MKILYAFPEELPLPKARGLQACATASALSTLTETWLVAPFTACPFKAYGFAPFPSLRRFCLQRSMGPLKSVLLWALKFKFLTLKLKPDIVLVRHPKLAYLLFKLKVSPIVFEVHEILKDKHPEKKSLFTLEKEIYSRAHGLIFISRGLKRRAQEVYAFKSPNLILPSGTFLCSFCTTKKFVSEEVKDIYYVGTGHYLWKGLDTLFMALEKLPSYRLHFVGPLEMEKIPASLKKRIRIYGWQKLSQLQRILFQAQIGVLPNTGKETVSRLYTSPMKLLDYLATKTAVAASDLPSVRELVSEREVLFFAPDDPSSLAEALLILGRERSLRERLALSGYTKAREYTWENRARKLYRFLREELGLT